MKRRHIIKNGILTLGSLPFFTYKKKDSMPTHTLEQLLLQRYHGIRRNIQGSVYDKMEESELRKMPYGMNSIAWNIWHMARAEDVGMNRLITDGQQVFDQGDYMNRLNISIRHFGTGMTSEEVQALSDTIDIPALKSYHEEVGVQTLKVFSQLDHIELDTKFDKDYLHQVMVEEGVLHKNALWVESYYQTKNKFWFLGHLGLTHNFEHLGQIMVVRKLLGYEGTR